MVKFEKSTKSDIVYALGILIIFLAMIFAPIFLNLPISFENGSADSWIKGMMGILAGWIIAGWVVKGLIKKKR